MQLCLSTAELQLLAELLVEAGRPDRRAELALLRDRVLARDLEFDGDDLELLSGILDETCRQQPALVSRLDTLRSLRDKIAEVSAML